LKFETPEALGAWAQANNVTSARFHPDGTLARVEFIPAALATAQEQPDTDAQDTPNKTAVTKALTVLSGGRDAWTDNE
jgi:hypothetical protein